MFVRKVIVEYKNYFIDSLEGKENLHISTTIPDGSMDKFMKRIINSPHVRDTLDNVKKTTNEFCEAVVLVLAEMENRNFDIWSMSSREA